MTLLPRHLARPVRGCPRPSGGGRAVAAHGALPVLAAQAQNPQGESGLQTPPKEEGVAFLPHEARVLGPSSQGQVGETPAAEELPCNSVLEEAREADGRPQRLSAPQPAGSASSVAGRTLLLPVRFRQRLSGGFLEHLQRRYSVFIFMNSEQRQMDIRGAVPCVMKCCGAVKAPLSKWRAQELAPLKQWR